MRVVLAIAALLAAGMVAAGVTAGRVLRERDAAVREGVLTRVAHGLESELRREGPDAASDVLRAFLARTAEVSAIEITNGRNAVAREGEARGTVVEVPLALGPGWRDLLPGTQMPRTTPPFRMRIWPGAGVGDSSRLATIATWGSILAAAALLAFSVMAARGVGAKQRAAGLDSERRRLELVALAGSGLAHRIRNPLATMKATAQILESTLAGADRDRASRIADAASRTETLLDELLRFARPVEPRPESLVLAELVSQFGDEARIAAAGGPIRVRADREHLISAIEELIANARAFDSQPPEIAVRRSGRNALVEVSDRGPGLQIDAKRAFDPYVTTRPDGAGLGLPTVAALIRANGGTLALENRSGGGCVATITLPEDRA